MPETHRYDYDLILRHVGDFGSYQKKILLMLSCVSAVGGLAVVIFPFTGFVPNFRFINYPPFIFDLFYCVDWNFVIRCRVVNFTQDPSLSPWIGNLSFDFNNRCRNLVGNLITNSALVSWHVPSPRWAWDSPLGHRGWWRAWDMWARGPGVRWFHHVHDPGAGLPPCVWQGGAQDIGQHLLHDG